MTQVKDFRYFYITSGNQLSNTNTFSIYLDIPENRYDRVTLTNINIPVSFYVIQNGHNQFVLRENSTSVTITIPEGNYNINSFITALTSLLNANSPNGLTYSLSIPNTFSQCSTGKITYVQNNGAIQSSFTFPEQSHVYEQFGFNRQSTAYFSGTTLTSSNVVKFIPEDSIHLHSNLVGTTSGDDIISEAYFSNSIPFSNITYSNPNPYQTAKYLNNGIKYASFSVTNEYNDPIYLNGLNISMTLLVYKEITINDILESFCKLLTIKIHQADEKVEEEKRKEILSRI